MNSMLLRIGIIILAATGFGQHVAGAESADRMLLVSNHLGDAQIYLLESGELKALTSGPGENTQPVCSPDGRRIVFTSMRDGNMDIYLMDADGSNLKRLTDHPQPDNVPSWSPDGGKILFRSYRDRHANLYVMDADGSNLKRLTDTEFDKGKPYWSPDGRHIAYTVYGDFAKSQIHIMNADGTADRDVTTALSKDKKIQPAWSPHGRKLAFVSVKSSHEAHIYLIDADGSNPVNLTDNPFMNTMPAWSPDGKRLAFVSNRTNRKVGRAAGDIYRMNIDGSEAVNLSRHEANDDEPAWSADGETLYFLSMREGLSQIYVQRPDGGEPERLTSHNGHDLMFHLCPEGGDKNPSSTDELQTSFMDLSSHPRSAL